MAAKKEITGKAGKKEKTPGIPVKKDRTKINMFSFRKRQVCIFSNYLSNKDSNRNGIF